MPFGMGFRVSDSFDEAPGSSSGTTVIQPDSIAGLTQWYKSDVGVTGTTKVTAWADQSGEGNGLVEFDGGTGADVALNDIGGIDFVQTFNAVVGEGVHLQDVALSAAAQPDGGTQLHFFAVVNQTSGGGQVFFNWTNSVAGTPGLSLLSQPGEAIIRIHHGAGFENVISPTDSWLLSETVIVECEIDLSLGTSDEVKLTINDFEQTTSAVTATTFNTPGDGFVLGAQDENADNTDSTASAEIIVYNGKVLTSGERAGILNYLSDKYSITLGA